MSFGRGKITKKTHRLTRSQAIFDVALENHSVRFSEPECLIGGHQSIAFGCESRKNSRVNWASVVVDDFKSRPSIFGHGQATASENSVGRFVGDLDSESQPIADPHRLHLRAAAIQYANARSRSLRGRSDADHVRVADGHHAESDVPGGGVVGAANLVDLVRFGHHHAMSLDHNRVSVNSSLIGLNETFKRKW